jgi:oligopeptide/dipeptide ABC transporter ATP-binding protein
MNLAQVDRGAAPGQETLQLRDVHVSYRGASGRPVLAVRGADLQLARGEIVGLVGESGCGKSSLGRAAVGLEPVAEGSVTIAGRPVKPLGRQTRRADLRTLQLVFQDPYSSLNPRRKVGSQIADGVRAANAPRDEVNARVREVLDMIGMPTSAAGRFPHEFSGGQRQRLAIGRALAVNPSFLIADEPVSALDASAQASIAALLSRLCSEVGLGILFISHDLGVVRELAQRVAVMYLGKIVETGATDEVWGNARHPYTRALIEAIPTADGSGTLPVALAGEVPDPSAPPTGCSFHPRCPLAEPRCQRIDPPELPSGPGHTARCLLIEKLAPPTPREHWGADSADRGESR